MDATPKTQSARALARQHPADLAHFEQVARTAEWLFHALSPLHGLGDRELELLYCAALIHDIGLSVSVSGHHRHSLTLILESGLPAFSEEERLIVANICRYHRKALPSEKHEPFRALSREARVLVRRLAALLRIADGLDRAHENAVSSLEASETSPGVWTLRIDGPGDLTFAAWGASRKADLSREAYGVDIRIEPMTRRRG